MAVPYHLIQRETVFYYTQAKGRDPVFESKTCGFIIYGRDSTTKNKVVQLASCDEFNMSPFIEQPGIGLQIQFPNSKVANTFIEVEFSITADLTAKPEVAPQIPETGDSELDEVLKNIALTQELIAEEKAQREGAEKELSQVHSEIEGLRATLSHY